MSRGLRCRALTIVVSLLGALVAVLPASTAQAIVAAAPTVTKVAPNRGPLAGGNRVNITGTNLTGTSQVTFGGVAGTELTVVSSTRVTITAPARGSVGVVDVQVTAPGGTNTNTNADNYTYAAVPTITRLTPSQGPVAGGNQVTLTGTGLTGATQVSFDGIAGTNLHVTNANTLTVTAPAHALGTIDVTVTTPGGTSPNTTHDDYTYLQVPTVTGLSPANGPPAGGNTVTVTGTNLTGASQVSFGGVAGTNLNPVSATSLTVTAPAHATGTVDVAVTTPGGTSANSAADNYTYAAAPTVTKVAPNRGPLAGGNRVNITGTNLTGTSQVTFGGVAGTELTVVSSTRVTITAPARGSVGVVDVQVTAPGGTNTNTNADNYTYAAVPTITRLTPSQGPVAGGNQVTLTGTGLTGATQVSFDGIAGTNLHVTNANTLTVTAPAHALGTIDVTVTTPGGTSPNTTHDDYTYLQVPTVTGLSPANGPPAGGNTVTVTGTNLTGASQVSFGGVAGTNLNPVSATSLTVTAPAHATGTVDVAVTTPGGTSANSAADNYTYAAAPTVTKVAPNRGPLAGGNRVNITGTNLTGTSQVTFGGVAGTELTVVSSTRVTITAPARGSVGVVDVQVTAPGGTNTNTNADNYTYAAVPTITRLTPSQGPVAGGNQVTLTGTGLTGATQVSFDGIAGTNLHVTNANTLTVTAPAHALGTIDVTVTTPGGTSPNTTHDDYTYLQVPTVTGLSPANGPPAGGNTVTVTGTNLTGASQVSFGGVAGTNLNPVSATSLTVTAPAHATGTVDVAVTTPGGTSANSAADNYTYAAAPTVTKVAPNRGPLAGGNRVNITGTNLTGTSQVTFGGVAGTELTVVSSTRVTITAPARGSVGVVDVQVTAPGGTNTNTNADNYTYAAVPTITRLTPSQGPVAGGNQVTLTGTGLTGATQVSFDGIAGTNLHVTNANTLTVTAPAHALGTIDVTVTTPGGTSPNTTHDDYTYLQVPTVTGLSPANGPPAGGNTVTVTGTNLTGASQVSFGGVAGTNLNPVSATSLTVTAPAHATGTVDVAVTTPGGTSANSAADNYTYAAAPTVTKVAPNRGPLAGGNRVNITGTNLTGTSQVTFGGVAGTELTVVSSTRVTITAPARGSVGVVDVQVTAPGGTNTNTNADNYTYAAVPTITRLTPSQGPVAGGNQVTLTGTGLTGATQVSFDGIAGTNLHVTNANTLTVTAPAHALGTIDVTVTTPGGTSPNTTHDDYTYTAITDECGQITSSRTWASASLHRVTCPVTVAPGVTLTINAGATVKFADGASMQVNGTLSAAGTAASPVVFTSLLDDSVGGDTNGDGTATTPTPATGPASAAAGWSTWIESMSGTPAAAWTSPQPRRCR